MKRLILITLVFIIALNAKSQNITNKQFALINYELEISDEFRDDMKPVKKFLKTVEVHNKDTDDKLKALMVHHMYYHLAEELENNLEIVILPINTFNQSVNYNDFGYPKEKISKIQRIGDSPFYFKINVNIGSLTEEKMKMNPKLKGDITFPLITVDITVYSNEGIIPVFKWHGEKAAYKPFEVNERFFRTLVKENQLPDKPEQQKKEQESLFKLYSLAVSNLIENYKNN